MSPPRRPLPPQPCPQPPPPCPQPSQRHSPRARRVRFFSGLFIASGVALLHAWTNRPSPLDCETGACFAPAQALVPVALAH